MYLNKFKTKKYIKHYRICRWQVEKVHPKKGHQRCIKCKGSGRGLTEFKHHNRIVSLNLVPQAMFQDMIFLH